MVKAALKCTENEPLLIRRRPNLNIHGISFHALANTIQNIIFKKSQHNAKCSIAMMKIKDRNNPIIAYYVCTHYSVHEYKSN